MSQIKLIAMLTKLQMPSSACNRTSIVEIRNSNELSSAHAQDRPN